jgi:NAD(P)-dependent dehydrogenase (short-subunit alcohol dehydrogenase family)
MEQDCNVVIAGDGAIGVALLENLLQRPQVKRVLVLGRNPGRVAPDPRVSHLALDAEDPQSVEAAAAQTQNAVERVHLLLNTVGMLHAAGQGPEKRLKALRPEHLQQSFAVNAALLPLLAQAFSKLLRHDEPATFASLSARVGSIEDNLLGGWYSYRASKAAHNMLLRTLAREWRVSHRNVTVVALHPGTVRSRLSEPFLTDSYPHRVLSPAESAGALLGVIGDLGHEESGSFFDWQGKRIPW